MRQKLHSIAVRRIVDKFAISLVQHDHDMLRHRCKKSNQLIIAYDGAGGVVGVADPYHFSPIGYAGEHLRQIMLAVT
ncbi:hypothetical protein D3C71_2126430 [compost metagenome]